MLPALFTSYLPTVSVFVLTMLILIGFAFELLQKC